MQKKNKIQTLLAALLILSGTSIFAANPLLSPAADQQDQPHTVLPVRTGTQNEHITSIQAVLQEKLGNLLYELHAGTAAPGTAVLILLIAFFYGMLHALGPGHRKTVVFSLYLTRQAPWWEPAVTSAILALLHGTAAIIFMTIVNGIAGSIAATADKTAVIAEGYSFLVIIAVTTFFIIKETAGFLKNGHHHCCGHEQHTATTISLIPFLLSGLYPCPGAILILAFCYSTGIASFGNLCIVTMSLGMVLPVAAAAYLAWSGRKKLFNSLTKNKETAEKVSFSVEMAGYVFLLSISLYIAWPFIISLF
jgi:nickel/cobalt transporter (NicO) family protein